jgi:hypothetical protein
VAVPQFSNTGEQKPPAPQSASTWQLALMPAMLRTQELPLYFPEHAQTLLAGQSVSEKQVSYEQIHVLIGP